MITTLIFLGKSHIFAHNWTIQSPTVISEYLTLWKTHFCPCLTHTDCWKYWNAKGDLQKPFNLPHWSGLIHYGNQTDKRLVFWYPYLTKSMKYFSMWLNYMFEMIFIVEIKYEDSRNLFFVTRTILIVGSDFIKNQNSYLCLILFLFRIDSIQYIFVFFRFWG